MKKNEGKIKSLKKTYIIIYNKVFNSRFILKVTKISGDSIDRVGVRALRILGLS